MENINKMKFIQNLVRRAVTKAGSPLGLSIEIEASEKAVYKWMKAKSKPDANNLISILLYLNEIAL